MRPIAEEKSSTPEFPVKYDWCERNWVQLGVFVLTLAIGFQFFIYVMQATGEGEMTVDRPPGVEGFLPIGALMAWKLFFVTGIWDPVHPAAMVILGFSALISLILRKSFCGWFCPVGTPSEWLWKLGNRIFGKNVKFPPWIDFPLRGLKYVLLGFFIWVIFSMDHHVIFTFLQGSYYKLSDVKMLFFFTRMTTLTAAVLALLVIASLVVRNFWCRYLCPYGALMGLLAIASPTRIQRNSKTCIGCKSCSEACPYYLPVDEKIQIISPECNGCMDCTKVCPVENTLQLKTSGIPGFVWNGARMGVAVASLFLLLVYTAQVTGHWKSQVSGQEFRVRLRMIDAPENTHPTIKF